MSGVYYGNEKSKFFENDFGTVSPHYKNESYKSSGPEVRLNDIEEHLDVAEEKCNSLTGQLEYMKQVYGAKKKSRKISSAYSNVKTDELSTSSVSFASADRKSLPKRQNSNAIGTDNSGAAVKTINNILTGITNSVNRLSELHIQISESPKNRTGRASNNSPRMVRLSGQRGIDSELVIDSGTVNILNKKNFVKKKSRESKGNARKPTSSLLLKKNVNKVSKRINNTLGSQPLSTATKRRISLMKPTNFVPKPIASARNPKIVEIFHNKEAKSSDSDECNRAKVANSDEDYKQIPVTNKDSEIPVLELPSENYPEMPASRSNTRRLCQSIIQQDDCYYSQGARRSNPSHKSYELPTIASRMKQAARTYFNTINFKTMVCKLVGGKMPNDKNFPAKKVIPFCAAISTSPSHNIGINIQQVMNIIKNRQPINGISPTLAHNIGLAAERLNSKPLSTLVTTINSNICYLKPQQCPLSKCKLNYQHLQDLAKSIPEETVEEIECEDQQQDVKTIIITGPSGDMEVKHQDLPKWTADRTEDVCTCVPNEGLNLDYVCNKVNKQSGNVNASQISVSQKTTKNVSIKSKSKKDYRPHSTEPSYTTSSNIFEGKEKNLKIVLTHLHDEFESLNKRYEDLSEKAAKNNSAEVIKKLETLETELVKKEEEITMVMNLCKEVMALKQQIKTLKQHSSQCEFSQEKKDNINKSNVSDFSNPQAAFHLTKLLKQIQTYQIKYKNGVGV